MKNSKGEVLENTMEGASINYLHGSGQILPALEADLNGLEVGDKKSIIISKASGFNEIDDDFYFDVIIDDVRLATKEELLTGNPMRQENDCGPDCCC